MPSSEDSPTCCVRASTIGCAGFADGNNYYARIGMQIVEVFADAQHAPLAMHMPRVKAREMEASASA